MSLPSFNLSKAWFSLVFLLSVIPTNCCEVIRGSFMRVKVSLGKSDFLVELSACQYAEVNSGCLLR